ncbi:MAG TPA: hypothetical protein VKR58_10105, partial [Aquella sp.]|nr:hypothetical protein [Aquella sp.]
YQMQALSNPVLWAAAANNPAMQQQLIGLMSKMPGTASGQTNNLPSPPAQGGIGNSLLGMLVNKITGNSSSPNPINNSLANSPSVSQMPATNAMNQTTGPSTPAVNPTPSTQPNTIPDSTIQRTAAGNPLNGVNPVTISNAQAAALNATATNEAQNQQSQWKERQDLGNNAATSAQNNINYLNKLKSSYPNLGWYERGYPFGAFPGVTQAANDVDTASSAMADSVARANQEGHITNSDRNIYSTMKPSRTQSTGGFNDAVTFNMGMNQRLLEVPQFNIAAQNAGLTPSQAQAVWTYYSRKEPFYDSKKNEIINDNLGKWEDYLTPDKVKEALSPKQQKLSEKEMPSQGNSKTTPGNNLPDVNVSAPRLNSASSKSGYDPTTILNYNFKDPKEFREAFNTLDDSAKQQVIAEMKKRGWT